MGGTQPPQQRVPAEAEEIGITESIVMERTLTHLLNEDIEGILPDIFNSWLEHMPFLWNWDPSQPDPPFISSGGPADLLMKVEDDLNLKKEPVTECGPLFNDLDGDPVRIKVGTIIKEEDMGPGISSERFVSITPPLLVPNKVEIEEVSRPSPQNKTRKRKYSSGVRKPRGKRFKKFGTR